MIKYEIERMILTVGGVQVTGFASGEPVYIGPEKCGRCLDTGIVSMYRVARDSSGAAIVSASGEPLFWVYSHAEQCDCGAVPKEEISINDGEQSDD